MVVGSLGEGTLSFSVSEKKVRNYIKNSIEVPSCLPRVVREMSSPQAL